MKTCALLLVALLGACAAQPVADESELAPPISDLDNDDVGDDSSSETEDDDQYGPTKCVFRDLEPVGEMNTEMQTFYLDTLSKWSSSFAIDGNLSLRISLNEGVGSLAGGVQPGTYPITGADTRAEDCAICVTLYGRNADDKLVRYIAKGGTLEITEADGDSDVLHGTLTELAMVPYDTTHIIGPPCTDHDQCGNNTCYTNAGQCYVSVPLGNHCETSIGNLTF